MAYLKPSAFTAKVFNRVAMAFGLFDSSTLVVPERTSGKPRKLPVIPFEHDGAAERPPLIDAYRAKAGRTVETYWKQLPDPVDHPVFRIES